MSVILMDILRIPKMKEVAKRANEAKRVVVPAKVIEEVLKKE